MVKQFKCCCKEVKLKEDSITGVKWFVGDNCKRFMKDKKGKKFPIHYDKIIATEELLDDDDC